MATSTSKYLRKKNSKTKQYVVILPDGIVTISAQSFAHNVALGHLAQSASREASLVPGREYALNGRVLTVSDPRSTRIRIRTNAETMEFWYRYAHGGSVPIPARLEPSVRKVFGIAHKPLADAFIAFVKKQQRLWVTDYNCSLHDPHHGELVRRIVGEYWEAFKEPLKEIESTRERNTIQQQLLHLLIAHFAPVTIATP